MTPLALLPILGSLLGCGTPADAAAPDAAAPDAAAPDAASSNAAAPAPLVPAPSAELELPATPAVLEGARTIEARLDHRSHRDLPTRAPAVLVHAPDGLRPESARVVVYLHGWGSCARAVLAEGPVACGDGTEPVGGQALATRHDGARTNTVMVVPQLAWRANSGTPGAFRDPAFARGWLDELVQAVLEPQLGIEDVGALTVVAHSGGYLTALAMLDAGLPVRDVVLLDALYGGGSRVARWVLGDPRRRALSLHTPHPGTTGQSRTLGARGAAAGLAVAWNPPSLADGLAQHRIVVARTDHPHGLIPQRQLAEVLRGLELPVRGDGWAEGG